MNEALLVEFLRWLAGVVSGVVVGMFLQQHEHRHMEKRARLFVPIKSRSDQESE